MNATMEITRRLEPEQPTYQCLVCEAVTELARYRGERMRSGWMWTIQIMAGGNISTMDPPLESITEPLRSEWAAFMAQCREEA